MLSGLNNATLVEVIARARGIPVAPGSDLIFSSLFRELNISEPVKLVAWSGRGESAYKRNLEIKRIEPRGDNPALVPFSENASILAGLEFSGSVRGRRHVGQIAFARIRGAEPGEFSPLGSPVSEGVGLVATPFSEHQDFIHAAFLRPGWRSPHRVHDILVRAKRDRAESNVINVLKAVVPSLRDVQPYAEGGIPIIYVDLGEGPLMPVPMLGAGIANLVDIAIWIGAGPAGIILIDEIEDGLHYTVLPKVARVVLELSHLKGLQILITTHSREAVNAFAKAAAEHSEQVAFFNLVRSDAQHKAVRYSAEETRNLLEIDSDIR